MERRINPSIQKWIIENKMNLYVARHGQTDYNIKGVFQGQSDIPLNANGLLQANELCDALQNISIDFIFSSPLKRAIETAKPTSNFKNISIQTDSRLLERSFGTLEGKAPTSDYNGITLSNIHFPCELHQVESFSSLFHRVYSFLDDLKKKYPSNNILIVTHACIYQIISCYFEGIPENGDVSIYSLANGSFKKFEC